MDNSLCVEEGSKGTQMGRVVVLRVAGQQALCL